MNRTGMEEQKYLRNEARLKGSDNRTKMEVGGGGGD